jgi:hypothetical protein
MPAQVEKPYGRRIKIVDAGFAADSSMILKVTGRRALPCAGPPINAYLFAWLEIEVDVLEDQV